MPPSGVSDFRQILMLEDDWDRLERFKSVLAKQSPAVKLEYRRSAPDFITAFLARQSDPQLIALDHDLFVDSPNDPDPGDGRDVARFLATQKSCCPVLIHSTNSVAADSMLFTLLDAGWSANRIAPIGDDWIEADWQVVARQILNQLAHR